MKPGAFDQDGNPILLDPTIQETPAALVEDGRIHTGFFREPFRRVNLHEAANFGGALGGLLRWLRLKEWLGFGFAHPELYGAMIIQNAKYAASGTVYVYDRAARRKYEWLVADWPGRVQLPEQLWQGESRCQFGTDVMHFRHDLTHGRHHVRVRLCARGQTPALETDLMLHQDLRDVDPLVVSLPIAPQHHTYTHKSPLRLEGEVRVGDRTYRYDPTRDLGNLDEQKTWYPYRSRWHWGAFAGRSRAGQEVALNMVNQMTPADQPGEDALWVDGRLMLLPQPTFSAQGAAGHYLLEDRVGRIRLQFVADGAKSERRNWGFAALDYDQFFGSYTGEVVDDVGRIHVIDDLYGVVERMRARF